MTSGFGADVREFFETNLQRRDTTKIPHLVGGAFRRGDADDVVAVRRYQAALHAAGLAWLGGPKMFGGGGRSRDEVAEFWRIAAEYELPDTNVLLVGLQIITPALAQFGTDEQRRRWLPGMLRGDLIGCQLFSEPDAGSDLASLRTRAVRDGDGWRVSGQKVWSSGAHRSDIGELLARTEPDADLRHRGLSMFIVDMDMPGLTVRPLRQMNGSSHFCEVHLDDVFVPGDRLLGGVANGWAVAQVSLSSERDGFGDESSQLLIDLLDRLLELAAEQGVTGDANVRQALARAVTRERIGDWLTPQLGRARGEVAGVGPSLTKLFTTRSDWEIAQVASRLLGPEMVAGGGPEHHAEWPDVLLGVPSPRIAGGTDEIQKNIVAERGLGLPREPNHGRQPR